MVEDDSEGGVSGCAIAAARPRLDMPGLWLLKPDVARLIS